MDNDLNNLIREVKELLIKYRQSTLTLHEINVKMPNLLTKLLSYLGKQRPVLGNNEYSLTGENVGQYSTVAIANGRRLSENEIKDINEEDFDVILDIKNNTLKFRRDPSHRSVLEPSLLMGVGSRRIEILSYLMQHPQRHISIDNITCLPKQHEVIASNTLAKGIGILRRALGEKSCNSVYILTEQNLEDTHCRYKLNPEWKYLLIKNFQNHG